MTTLATLAILAQMNETAILTGLELPLQHIKEAEQALAKRGLDASLTQARRAYRAAATALSRVRLKYERKATEADKEVAK